MKARYSAEVTMVDRWLGRFLDKMDEMNLSVIFDGGDPKERAHFTLGYDEYVWTRDEQYVMFSRYDGAWAKLYDLVEDPGLKSDIASERPYVVRRMFEDYVLEDAGGPLPHYDA